MTTRLTQRRRDQDPPDINEIRRVRARLLKRAGGTLDGLVRMLRESQDQLEASGKAMIVRSPQSAKAKRARRAA